MRRNIIIKALVLGTIGCAFSATGFAADVQNGHGQGITDSTTEVMGLSMKRFALVGWIVQILLSVPNLR